VPEIALSPAALSVYSQANVRISAYPAFSPRRGGRS
jgi:hypothetical protein